MRHFAFKNLADLGHDVRAWLDRMPRDFELVAGVPRSGLLVAGLISLHRHIPMTDVTGLVTGRLQGGGHRFESRDPKSFLARPRRVLVVDDSVLTGRQMRSVREQISAADLGHAVSYAAVYVEPGKEGTVDHFCESLPYPRMFEWNLMHHPMLENACVDIDGVLCRDPTEEENDDGPLYARFIRTVRPRATPAFRIGTLVTCRLEKYRSETEEWLATHGVQYDDLVMMQHGSRAERLAVDRHAEFKAKAYQAAGGAIFIESNFRQARDIAELANRPVVATDRMVLAAPAIQTKSDIMAGFRGAGSMTARMRWLRQNRRAIQHWARRRWAARRTRRS